MIMAAAAAVHHKSPCSFTLWFIGLAIPMSVSLLAWTNLRVEEVEEKATKLEIHSAQHDATQEADIAYIQKSQKRIEVSQERIEDSQERVEQYILDHLKNTGD